MERARSHYDFCVRCGWERYIDQMIVIDYLILNRDRHGANIEILRNTREHSLRIAPLFDHGLSLMYSCMSDQDIDKFDIMEDKRCQNFIGGYSCYDNLQIVGGKKELFTGKLQEKDKTFIFDGLQDIVSDKFIEKAWNMIYERYKIYENL